MYQTFIKPFYQDVKTFVLDTLFPISCLSCGQEGDFTHQNFFSKKVSDEQENVFGNDTKTENFSSKNLGGLICADCKSTMKQLEHQRCIVCQKQTPFGLTHPICQTPHGADGLISFYDYHDNKVSQIIIKGKYSFIPGTYKVLGKIVAQKLKADHEHLISTPYTLTPIPLHPSRKRWRGFNQAEILCQTLSSELNLPIADVLQRNKITKTQKNLKKDQRLKNVSEAFKLKADADVHNKNIILIDDVTTTGATLQEAAKVLKRNGAATVICLTVARD